MFSIKFELNKNYFNLIVKLFLQLFVVLIVAYIIYILVFINDFWLKGSGVILVCVSVCNSVPFFYAIYRGYLPNFSDWFRIGTFFSLVLEAFFLLHELEEFNTIQVFNSIKFNSFDYFKAVLVLLVGTFSFILVDFFISRKRLKRINQMEFPFDLFYIRKRIAVFFSFLILVIDIYLNLTSLTGFGSTSSQSSGQMDFVKQFVNVFASLNLVTLSVLFFFTENSKVFKFYFYSFVLINLVVALFSGMKESVITVFIYTLIPYYLSGRNFKIKHFVIIIFILVFIFPFNKRYRKALELTENKAVAFYLALQNNEKHEYDNGQSALASRYFIFSPLIYGVSIENEWHHFKYMNRYIYTPLAWIVPGVILPGKPRNDFGRILYQELRNTNVSTVSITPSTFGWVYLEGGYFFVFILFLVFGVVLKYLDSLVDMNSLQGLLVYIVIVPGLIKIESDIYFRIVSYFQILLCLLFFRYLIGNLRIISEK